jgi:hypothetical protein
MRVEVCSDRGGFSLLQLTAISNNFPWRIVDFLGTTPRLATWRTLSTSARRQPPRPAPCPNPEKCCAQTASLPIA